jgi:hypothetical protein
VKKFLIIFFSLIGFLPIAIAASDHCVPQKLTCREMIHSDLQFCAHCCRFCARCSGSTALVLADRGSVLLCCLVYGVATRPCQIVKASALVLAAWPDDFERFYRRWNQLGEAVEGMKR